MGTLPGVADENEVWLTLVDDNNEAEKDVGVSFWSLSWLERDMTLENFSSHNQPSRSGKKNVLTISLLDHNIKRLTRKLLEFSLKYIFHPVVLQAQKTYCIRGRNLSSKSS
jgi:hypothetical protein